jgi:excinuclease UvrABC nuclease subunit
VSEARATPAPDLSALFKGVLRVQPPVTDEQLAQVPAKRGVVLLLAEGERPILLLTAADIRSRTRSRLRDPDPEERRKAPDLQDVTREVRWTLAGGHFEADLLYLERAAALWPGRFAEMVAWRPAWFVHVDPGARHPRFARTRDVFGGTGQYLGPFPDGRSADRFIEAVRDGFDLCREHECVRRSPHGPPCAYSQMGRCVGVGDGRMSLEEYRALVAKAAAYAAGRRDEHRAELGSRMKGAAAALRFERAASIKSRLERLADLEKPEYVHVAPAEEFRFILLQPSGSSRKAGTFLVNRGTVSAGEEPAYPPRREQLVALLERMRSFASAPQEPGELERYRMGLVSHYLSGSPERRGAIVRFRESLTPEELAAAMEGAAKALHLRAPAPRKTKESCGSADAKTDNPR